MKTKDLTLNQAKRLVNKMRSVRNWDTGARAAAISVCIEAAELLEHFQWEEDAGKILAKSHSQEKQEEIEMEVADILVYLCDFANCLNIDLSSALSRKLEKIDQKCPVEKILKHGDNFYYQQKKKYREKD